MDMYPRTFLFSKHTMASQNIAQRESNQACICARAKGAFSLAFPVFRLSAPTDTPAGLAFPPPMMFGVFEIHVAS